MDNGVQSSVVTERRDRPKEGTAISFGSHNGETYQFELISIYDTGHSLGRLTAIRDRTGEEVRIENGEW